jgi:hypothetical protein
MTSEKYLRLVSLLIKRTNENTAQWEPTSRDGVFALSLPDYTVRISIVRGGDDTQDVTFQIVNSEGTLIDTFTDNDAAAGLSDKTPAYRDISNLYDQARRQALGVDKALDQLIEELGKP